MRIVEFLLVIICGACFIWAFGLAGTSYINLKQYLYRDTYRLVEFEVKQFRGVTGDLYAPYGAFVIGTVERRTEKMGLGHFYLRSEILPADAEQRFKPGTRFLVYYNPELSNFTINNRTARFVPPERYVHLTLAHHIKMLIAVYGPLMLSLLAWALAHRHNKSLNRTRTGNVRLG